MIRRTLNIVLAAFAVLVAIQSAAVAGPYGTAEEARALVDKAATLLASSGKDSTYHAFNDPTGAFVDRDLYIFVLDLKGTVEAHGANKGLIGKSLFNLRDAEGKAFVQEMIDVANSKAEGWVDYHWPNPVSKKVEAKSSYIKKVGDVFLGVGVYKG